MPAKRAIHLRQYLMSDMNPVIRFLILSDTVWQGAFGLLGPIFALFIVDFIQGGNELVAGVAAAIFLVTRSILQIPIASLIDRICGEKDDFWILFIGSLLGAAIPLAYLFVDTPAELYIVQFVFGTILAFTYPSYMAIFTKHIDKQREGTDWAIYFTFNDLAMAVTASIGGVLAVTIGYHKLILVVVAISIIGALFVYPLRRRMYKSC